MMSLFVRIARLAAVAALAALVVPAIAADLRIGRSNEQSSMDPQFSRTGRCSNRNGPRFSAWQV